MTNTHTGKVDVEAMRKALRLALEIIQGELEAETYSHAIGGWDGKSEPKLGAEGWRYIRPLRDAIKQINTALSTGGE